MQSPLLALHPRAFSISYVVTQQRALSANSAADGMVFRSSAVPAPHTFSAPVYGVVR